MKHRVLISLALGVLGLLAAPAYAANTGSFTITTTVNADGTLSPKASWSTTPAATSCTASGDWSGTKAASGSEDLPSTPANVGKAYLMSCSWPGDTQAFLTWVMPDKYTDGSAATKCASATSSGNCIAKYRVKHGTVKGTWPDVKEVADPTAASYTWGSLPPGQNYFVVTAVSGYGAESDPSNEPNKTTTASVNWSQQIGIKVPNPPSNFSAN